MSREPMKCLGLSKGDVEHRHERRCEIYRASTVMFAEARRSRNVKDLLYRFSRLQFAAHDLDLTLNATEGGNN